MSLVDGRKLSVCWTAVSGRCERLGEGPDTIEESLSGLRFRVSAEAFFQVNTAGAERLLDVLCGYATRGSFPPPFAHSRSGGGASAEGTGAEEEEDKEEEKGCGPALVLDVCCGTGTIGLALARHTGCRRVLGVENCAPAVADARINASLNDLDSVATCIDSPTRCASVIFLSVAILIAKIRKFILIFHVHPVECGGDDRSDRRRVAPWPCPRRRSRWLGVGVS